MHGNYWNYQLPDYGNKFIGTHNGIIDMHGKKKLPTWTELSASAQVGDMSITLTSSTNWEVGDDIVIAPTGYNHFEAEQRTILTITDGEIITFEDPLEFYHHSAVDTYDGVDFPMRAEVTCITRNIVVQGDES